MMRLPAFALLIAAAPLSAGIAQTPTTPLPAGHPPISGSPSAPAPAATHSGTVTETLDAPPYVYIHVKGEAGDQWLAAPSVKLAAGTTIRWPDGLVMTNFHSKTLDRTFDTVYFVNSVTALSGK